MSKLIKLLLSILNIFAHIHNIFLNVKNIYHLVFQIQATKALGNFEILCTGLKHV